MIRSTKDPDNNIYLKGLMASNAVGISSIKNVNGTDTNGINMQYDGNGLNVYTFLNNQLKTFPIPNLAIQDITNSVTVNDSIINGYVSFQVFKCGHVVVVNLINFELKATGQLQILITGMPRGVCLQKAPMFWGEPIATEINVFDSNSNLYVSASDSSHLSFAGTLTYLSID